MIRNPNEIVSQDNKITTILTKSKKYGNHIVEIDSDDYDIIKVYYWRIAKKPNRDKYYIKTNINSKKHLFLHRLIMNLYDTNLEIDHIDNNTLNNKKENLRICNRTENMHNRIKYVNNKSGYKGVYFSKVLKKWHSRIQNNKEHIHLGYFNDIKDAAIAYNKAAVEYHGEYARLNEV